MLFLLTSRIIQCSCANITLLIFECLHLNEVGRMNELLIITTVSYDHRHNRRHVFTQCPEEY